MRRVEVIFYYEKCHNHQQIYVYSGCSVRLRRVGSEFQEAWLATPSESPLFPWHCEGLMDTGCTWIFILVSHCNDLRRATLVLVESSRRCPITNYCYLGRARSETRHQCITSPFLSPNVNFIISVRFCEGHLVGSWVICMSPCKDPCESVLYVPIDETGQIYPLLFGQMQTHQIVSCWHQVSSIS